MHVLVKHKNVCPRGSIVRSLNLRISIKVRSFVSQRVDEELETIESSYVVGREIDLKVTVSLRIVFQNSSLVFVKQFGKLNFTCCASPHSFVRQRSSLLYLVVVY